MAEHGREPDALRSTQRRRFQNYDASDGLPATGFYLGSVNRAPSGEMFAGGPEGLVAFMPAAITANPYVPPIVFTDLLLGNQAVPISDTSVLTQTIDTTDNLVLPYDARVIAVEFAALNYEAPAENRYRYRMDGFDEQWTEVASSRRLVTYTNLNPGSYVFRVTGSNNDGVWNEAGRALTIVIVPPWWQTWWFRTLLLGSLVGLAVADDGRGFELATAAPDSFGQAIMRERAAEIGTALQVRSGVGQGTTVTVV